jgi:predicted esterase
VVLLRWALSGALIALFFTTGSAKAEQTQCIPIRYNVSIRHNLIANVAYFQAVDPQGAALFVLGPQRSYEGSLSFIKKFCHLGFSVAAFDLVGRHITKQDFVSTALKVAARLHQAQPHLHLISYGWSKGASVAVHVAASHKRLFSKIILENPKLDSQNLSEIRSLPGRMTRIFQCRVDLPRLRRANLSSHAELFIPAHGAACSHQLSAVPAAQGPMLDSIEGDFAGFQSYSWYFSRIL